MTLANHTTDELVSVVQYAIQMVGNSAYPDDWDLIEPAEAALRELATRLENFPPSLNERTEIP